MKYLKAISFSIITFISISGALSQPAQNDKKATRHQEQCESRYAYANGKIAYLEARLKLNQSQKLLFDRWKEVRLKQAEEHQNTCASHTANKRQDKNQKEDRLTRKEEQLKKQLANAEAEKPTFTAFYASLTPEQQSKMAGRADNHRQGDKRRRA